jgi:hypothetical protein
MSEVSSPKRGPIKQRYPTRHHHSRLTKIEEPIEDTHWDDIQAGKKGTDELLALLTQAHGEPPPPPPITSLPRRVAPGSYLPQRGNCLSD